MGQSISISDDISTSGINVIDGVSIITSRDCSTKINELMKDSPSLSPVLTSLTPRGLEDDFRNNKLKPLDIIKRIKWDPRKFSSEKVKQDCKACFVCCNSYENSRYALGDPAINDGLLAYINLEKHGYDVFMFHDMSKHDFMDIFQKFISLENSKVAVYYIGHGVTVKDTSGDEKDGTDECLYFLDGTILDDELYKCIQNHKSPKNKLVLISDCCHSGTIYDVPDRDDIITLSAAADHETAKQDWIDRKGHGIFTYYLWKYYDNNLTLAGLRDKMSKKLSIYQQQFITNRTKLDISDVI